MARIPLFPLNAVLFPGMPIQLHIFEERYLQLVRDCLRANQPFGVALIRRGMEALGPLAEPHLIGVSANIVQIDGQPDGRLNLTAIGDERFRILELDDSGPYLSGQIERLPIQLPPAPELARGVRRLAPWMRAYLRRLAAVSEPGLPSLEMPEEPILMVYLAAAVLQVPLAEKQVLLGLPTAGELLNQVVRLLRREVSVLALTGGISEEAAARSARLN